ncbi:MAG: polymer-forming cytoskeletal protein [Candidatus Eisenbacteria sp.]|nr:polymer-forming cytoskeletal protein [Candidatus Eisenbacteria bacterium]
MFGKSSPQPPATQRPERSEQSFLQSGVRLQGEIEVAGDLRVEGTIKGALNVRGILMIGPKAVVEGDVRGREVVVHGRLGGTLRADERIHLSKGAKVKGELYCSSLIIDEGVFFEGRSHMNGLEKPSATGSDGKGLDKRLDKGQKKPDAPGPLSRGFHGGATPTATAGVGARSSAGGTTDRRK